MSVDQISNLMLNILHGEFSIVYLSLADTLLVKLSECITYKVHTTVFENTVIKWTEYTPPIETYTLFEKVIMEWKETYTRNATSLPHTHTCIGVNEKNHDFEKNLFNHLEALANYSPEFYSKFAQLFLQLFNMPPPRAHEEK